MSEPTETQNNLEEIEVEYANNVTIEATAWDLKVIFGEYSDRAKEVEWHTSITMPMATARLLAYYLEANVQIYEALVGKVPIPKTALPPNPVPPEGADEDAMKAFEILKAHREKFMADHDIVE